MSGSDIVNLSIGIALALMLMPIVLFCVFWVVGLAGAIIITIIEFLLNMGNSFLKMIKLK
mgnify:CR=1 FL=1|tara:strand:+ start:1353 stop:1532 length:180 start_codon:yes stop_codon:yes gene_type:complete